MTPTIEAVCVLIQNGTGEYLGVSRKDDHNAFGLPGGKVDPGETPETAALRELEEETGLWGDPFSLELQYQADCPGGSDGKSYWTALYTCDVTGTIQTTEAGRVAWITAQQLLDGPFGIYNELWLEELGQNGLLK